jgi:hypothetical protein
MMAQPQQPAAYMPPLLSFLNHKKWEKVEENKNGRKKEREGRGYAHTDADFSLLHLCRF